MLEFFWHFLKRYKVTIFFLFTYWVLNSVLYWLFGSAYLFYSSNENKLLVFLSGPFSFAEDFTSNYSLSKALALASTSENFWLPFAMIFFVEWKIRDRFEFAGFKINMWKSYSIGVAASYLNSVKVWFDSNLHAPTTGTSIIAFALLLTYFVLFPLCPYIVPASGRLPFRVHPSIPVGLVASLFAVAFLVLFQFILLNSSASNHAFGFLYYGLIYLLFFLVYLSHNKNIVRAYWLNKSV